MMHECLKIPAHYCYANIKTMKIWGYIFPHIFAQNTWLTWNSSQTCSHIIITTTSSTTHSEKVVPTCPVESKMTIFLGSCSFSHQFYFQMGGAISVCSQLDVCKWMVYSISLSSLCSHTHFYPVLLIPGVICGRCQCTILAPQCISNFPTDCISLNQCVHTVVIGSEVSNELIGSPSLLFMISLLHYPPAPITDHTG